MIRKPRPAPTPATVPQVDVIALTRELDRIHARAAELAALRGPVTSELSTAFALHDDERLVKARNRLSDLAGELDQLGRRETEILATLAAGLATEYAMWETRWHQLAAAVTTERRERIARCRHAFEVARAELDGLKSHPGDVDGRCHELRAELDLLLRKYDIVVASAPTSPDPRLPERVLSIDEWNRALEPAVELSRELEPQRAPVGIVLNGFPRRIA